MQMNPNIVLSGQTVDPVGSMARGAQAAAGVNQVRRQNELANLYQEQGAGLLSGDQNALNALAGLDPVSALGMQAQHQANARADQKAQMDAVKMAQELSAAEAAQAKEQLMGGLKMAAGLYANGDQAGFDALMGQYGLEVPFDQFPTYALQFADVIDALGVAEARNAPPKPADEYGRYVQEEEAAGRVPLSRINFAKAKQKSTSLSVDSDGNITFTEGQQDSKPLTDAQSKSVIYSTRAQGALDTLNSLDTHLTGRANRAADLDPTGFARELQTPEYQQAAAAADEFLTAILRKDTGAAITNQEIEIYGKLYLPQPGDSEEVIVSKRAARARALDALKAGMGPDEIARQEKALGIGAAPAGVKPEEWKHMTDEEKALFQ